MAEKRKRGQNFTNEEKEKFLNLLEQSKDTVLNKKTDGPTSAAKAAAWDFIAKKFNSYGSVYRSKESLMKLWEKMKSEGKIYWTTSRKSTMWTGVGPCMAKTDYVMERVCEILGRGCTGIIGAEDYDAAPYIENEEPIWKRRLPIESKEQTNSVTQICSSFSNINKTQDTEDLRQQLLLEEIEFKQKLYALQLQATAKDLEIKEEILRQIKDGSLISFDSFAFQKKE